MTLNPTDTLAHLADAEFRAGFERGRYLASQGTTAPQGTQTLETFFTRQVDLYEAYHGLSIANMPEFCFGLLAGLRYPSLPWDTLLQRCTSQGWSIEETVKRVPDTREYIRVFDLLDANGRLLLAGVGAMDIEIYVQQ